MTKKDLKAYLRAHRKHTYELAVTIQKITKDLKRRAYGNKSYFYYLEVLKTQKDTVPPKEDPIIIKDKLTELCYNGDYVSLYLNNKHNQDLTLTLPKSNVSNELSSEEEDDEDNLSKPGLRSRLYI